MLTTGRKDGMLNANKTRPLVENKREGEGKVTYAEVFSEIKGKFMEADVSDIKEHLAYQFNITGEGSGIFYVEVKEGVLSVEPYEFYDRDAMFTCDADTLAKIASKKLDPVLAVTLQKLKVEGNIEKALRLKELIDSRQR